MTFHCMDSYFKPELRLPLRQPFDSTYMHQNRFLTVHIMDINVNPDRKMFRYSGVDTAIVWSHVYVCIHVYICTLIPLKQLMHSIIAA